ncbi:MAG TPA: SRPBCC family protein [Pseudonocardiaceae bacterium]|nr:SRPBCC family protein [Pseudonocardiaceae bacterium]
MSRTEISAAPGIPLIIVSREFDAPCELVFRAHIEPDLLERWLGPRDLTLTVERWEARDCGAWRYVNTGADGATYGFRGVFHGDPSPRAIVQTFEYEGAPGHVALRTTAFTERGGRTLVRMVSAFQSVEDRDAMVASGMARGVHDSGDRLAELLTTLHTNPGDT